MVICMANLLNISSNEADSAKDSILAEINQLKLLNQNIKRLQESLVNQRITTLQTELSNVTNLLNHLINQVIAY